MSRVRTLGADRCRSEIEKPRGPRTAPDGAKSLEEDLERRRIELKGWRRTERGLQMEEESVVFSNIEVRVKRAGPSGLGDPEVTEYIARIRSGPFERENGVSVNLATTEARFLPD